MTESEGAWWRGPFRMFQTNLAEIDADLDVEAVLDYLQRYGANVWLLNTAGIIANYPSALAEQTPNPALTTRTSGDLIGDAVDAATRRGIRVVGRTDFSKVDHRRAEQHPEWCFVGPDGSRQVYNGLVSVCPNGPYYQQRLFDVLAEVQQRYRLSGFFLNWMSFNEVDYSRSYRGICQCQSCAAAFARYAPEIELPTDRDSEHYPRWQRFAAERLADLTARIRDHLHRLSPEAALMLGDRADLIYHEANNATGRTLWHHRTSEAVSAARTLRPEVPVVVNATAFVDMPYRMSGEDPDHFAQYLLQTIAHGAAVSTYVMRSPLINSYPALQLGAQLFDFHRRHQDVYAGLRPTAEIALIRPNRGGAPASVRELARSEFEGVYLALTEGQLPFAVLDADRLTDLAAADDLPYRILVLPDTGPLAPAAVAALDGFVAAGGRVLCTGDSTLDRGAAQLAGAPVRSHLGSYTGDRELFSVHLRLQPDAPTLVRGALHLTEATTDADTDFPSTGRAPYGPPEKCYGHIDPGHPGFLRRTAGAGQIAMLPWTAGHVYRTVGLTIVRQALLDAVTGLGAAAIATDLPDRVQVITGESDAGRVVHLLNRSGDADQRFLAPLPIGASTITVPRAWGQHARALVADTELEMRVQGDRLQIATPELGRFEVLVISAGQPLDGSGPR